MRYVAPLSAKGETRCFIDLVPRVPTGPHFFEILEKRSAAFQQATEIALQSSVASAESAPHRHPWSTYTSCRLGAVFTALGCARKGRPRRSRRQQRGGLAAAARCCRHRRPGSLFVTRQSLKPHRCGKFLKFLRFIYWRFQPLAWWFCNPVRSKRGRPRPTPRLVRKCERKASFTVLPLKVSRHFPSRGIDELQGFRATFRKEVRKCGWKPKMDGRAQKVSPRKRGREYVTGRQISKVGAHTAAAPVFLRLAYLLILTGCEPSAQRSSPG